MRLNFKVRPIPVLLICAAGYIALWALLAASSNEVGSRLMHYNTAEVVRYYQATFRLIPEAAYPVDLFSGYYLLTSISLWLFGHSHVALFIPNLVAMLVLMAGLYSFGTQIRDRWTGTLMAIIAPALPPVFGMTLAIEGVLWQMAGLIWTAALLLFWTRHKKHRWLAATCLSAGLTICFGNQVTFQVLGLIHLGCMCLAVSTTVAYRRWRENAPLSSMAAPFIGSAIVGLFSLLVLGYLTRWGVMLAYQVGEAQRVQQMQAPGSWLKWPHYYFTLVIVTYMTKRPFVLLIVGLLAHVFLVIRKRAVMGWRMSVLAWITLPILILSAFNKPDIAYILPAAPVLAIGCGISASDLRRLGKIGAVTTLLLMFWVCGYLAAGSFEGYRITDDDFLELIRDKPSYPFLPPKEINLTAVEYEKQGRCLAKYADEVVGPGEYFLAALEAPENDFQERRAYISLYRPSTIAYNLNGDFPYFRFNEPDIYQFHVHAVVLDNQTAFMKDFRRMSVYWLEQVSNEWAQEKLISHIEGPGAYRRIGVRCGYILFKQELKEQK